MIRKEAEQGINSAIETIHQRENLKINRIRRVVQVWTYTQEDMRISQKEKDVATRNAMSKIWKILEEYE